MKKILDIFIISLALLIIYLSITLLKIKSLFILPFIILLIIIYFNIDNITLKIKKKNNYIYEGKEVEFVSSRERSSKNITTGKDEKKATKVGKKKKKEEKKKKFLDKLKSQNSDKQKDKIKAIKNRKNKKEKDRSKKEKKGIGRKILIAILGLAIVGIFGLATFMIYIVISAGSFDPNALANQDQTVIYDSKGNVITTLGLQKRETVDYDTLPQVLVDAIIATEDSRFFQHNGVDMARFLKASVKQVLGDSSAGGASTLTMQVVKNNLTDTSQSIIRKFKDIYISVFFMEKKYSKEEILEFYVNDSCLGGSVYGVEEASKYYFGKTVSELSLPEAALIAGMYQAPNKYNPYKNPDLAKTRRSTVLSLMVRHGYITQEEADMANAVDISSMLVGAGDESDYQGYIDTVIDEVQDKTGFDPTTVPMKVYTAMDKDIQDGINKVLSGEAHTWEDDELQAGIAVVNVNDGTIVAIGAGRNREGERTFNNATQAYRQPGSTAKPLFDYGPGFEYNDFSTYTLFNDERWNYTNGPEVGNWDGGYEGLITLRRALSYSRNVPALKAFQIVDTKKIVNFANGLGLDVAYSTSSDNYKKYDNGGDNLINEAYSIGGVSHGFTPLEMAEAYACFANGGYHINSHAVTKIEYRNSGEVVEFNEKKEKVMSDSTAYLMNNVLQYAVEAGFNGGARVYGSTVAAKTGTSNLPDSVIKENGLPGGAVNDLWTVAYTPEYSISLWYGYKNVDSSHYLSGASAPKDDVMRSVMKFIPKTTKKWEMPSSVVQVTVEKGTWPAQLPSEFTPDDMKITEYFKKGTQPTEISQRYAKLPVVTNLNSSKVSNGYKLTWNWKEPDILNDAYLSKYFNNSVFGNQSAVYLKNRIDYNQNTLGGIGFGIYKKTSAGALERLDFTTDTEYIYKPTSAGEVEIVVKAEYGSFKNNASDGVSTKVKSDGSSDTPTVPAGDKLEIDIGEESISVVKGTVPSLTITVTYNGDDVTSKANKSFKLDNTSYSNLNDVANKIKELDEGTYKITYTVTYKGKTETVTKNITII